ncbi:MAG: DNA repair protein [Gammaproteobacteria bacterium]|nr:DNA repair protein [Gammaproteobacteria bacterium]|tara:strand:+ start:14547 stop:17210 length:2664 start_codon:yes stop_codon:yes gene_type:complete
MDEQQKKYTKARFYKCALQVNTAEYIKYRGEEQVLSDSEYNQQLLDAALEAGIDIIGLASHGSINGFEQIRDLFKEHGIVVFPGFEIASTEKVHLVCLFDELTEADQIKMHLGALGVDVSNPAAPVQKTAIDIIEYVNNKNGFIYAAHCTNDDGVLKRRMNHVWQHKGLLAAQIPGSIDDLKGVESDFYRRVFLNNDINYKRCREMAAINAADVETPEKIKKKGASCLIKMTKPCFASFKQAFLDAGSRVRLNSDKIENYASAIEGIRFIGGYLDGVDIEFSEHLNAIIGGRGTGKSTMLECIRYGLGLEPKTQNAIKQHKNIVDTNLGNERGMVEITLRSSVMHGRQFKISRKYGNQPVVVDDQNNISPYHPTDLLPGLELYGQNEIYEMTRDLHSRNQLIERFLEGEHEQFDAEIANLLAKLKENRESIKQALNQKGDIESEVECLPKLLDQAKQYQALGIEEKLKIIPKLEKEKQLKTRVEEEVLHVKEAIQTLIDSVPDTVFLSDSALNELPNADLFKQQRVLLDELTTATKQSLKQLEQLVLNTDTQLAPLKQSLLEKHQYDEQNLEKAFKDIPTSQGKTGRQIGAEYQALLKQIEQIKPKQTQLQHRLAQIEELYIQRKKLLLELDQQTSARATSILKSVKQLTRKLENKIRLTLQPEGNRQVFFNFLSECNLEGIGVKRLAWVLEGNFSPSNLAATVRQGEEQLAASNFGIPNSVVKALTHLSEVKLLELEELQLPDTLAIELNVTHGEVTPLFKSIDDLSTGQQCTAVLHLLLLDNHDPLILDQPEDNLDNAFIADRIVAELRRAKLGRQFLFATHNANIPIFGDAEWIGVLSVDDNKGKLLPEQQGAIDIPKVQELAADILEGGKNAFNQRREKYGFI